MRSLWNYFGHNFKDIPWYNYVMSEVSVKGILFGIIPGVPPKSGTLNFRYFDIRKYSIFLFYQNVKWMIYQDHLIWFGGIDSTTIFWNTVIYKCYKYSRP